MRVADLFKLAWDNLRRNSTRSVLTIIGVLIGVAALMTLLAYGSGLQQNAQREFNALELYNTLRVTSNQIPALTGPGRVATQVADTASMTGQVPLTDSLVQEIEQLDGVLAAYPEDNFPGKLRANSREIVINAEAIPMEFQEIELYRPKFGTFFDKPDAASVMISPSMAKRLGFDTPAGAVGQPVEIITAAFNLSKMQDLAQMFSGGLNALPMGQHSYDATVAGIIKEDQQPLTGFTRALVPVQYAQTLDKITFFSTLDLLFRNADALDGYSAVRVQLTDAGALPDVRQEIEEMGVYATSFREQFDRLEQLFLIMDLALGIIGFIAMVVATIGIANTVMMNVRERYREIGVMMAVGGDAKDLQRLFVIESASLGALGGIAGLIFGGLIVLGLDAAVNMYLDSLGVPPISVFSTSALTMAVIFAGAVLISLLAGVVPARRAASIEPAEALRST
jgi:putative ABC transport system permease protein